MITIILIAITTAASAYAFKKPELFAKYQFNAYMVYHRKDYKRIISHIFLHGGWDHLIFNMITLYFFGTYAEKAFGILFYLLIYFGGAIVSTMPALFKHKDNHYYNAIGASGATSAALFSFILIEPLNSIYLFFIPIGIPAVIFGVLYLWYSAYMAKKNVDNIGHDAHFWGAIFGFTLPIFFYPGLIISFFQKILSVFA